MARPRAEEAKKTRAAPQQGHKLLHVYAGRSGAAKGARPSFDRLLMALCRGFQAAGTIMHVECPPGPAQLLLRPPYVKSNCSRDQLHSPEVAANQRPDGRKAAASFCWPLPQQPQSPQWRRPHAAAPCPGGAQDQRHDSPENWSDLVPEAQATRISRFVSDQMVI